MEAGVAPPINESGLAQTISLTLEQMLVFGSRYNKLKSVKVPHHEQQPSDDQLLRTVLDGMNVVILDVGAPDQVMEDVSNEVVDVGDNHGEVDSMSDPGNEVQTDSTTSKEPFKTTDVNQPPETSTVTNSGGLIDPKK